MGVGDETIGLGKISGHHRSGGLALREDDWAKELF